MEILGKILGSPARVKIMRLFLLNRENGFTNKDVAKKSRVSSPIARRELKILSSVKFIRKQRKNWFFNPSFKYAPEIGSFWHAPTVLTKKLFWTLLTKRAR